MPYKTLCSSGRGGVGHRPIPHFRMTISLVVADRGWRSERICGARAVMIQPILAGQFFVSCLLISSLFVPT